MTRTPDSLPAPAAHVAKGHAVVLGASLAGLLAARVLSARFQWVTLIEREAQPWRLRGPQVPQVPKVPQPHRLLARGHEALERLFPGLTGALQAGGASNRHLCLEVSHPALEAELRRRVLALPNICLREGAEVLMPHFDLAAGRVNGVCYRETAGGATQELAADWVVDCTGRGSRSGAWLARWGYAAAPVRQAGANGLRRHFEKLRRFPLGFLVMGDAQACLDPASGHGMTLAACQAQALDDAFAHGGPALAQRFFKACARVIDVPWHLALGADPALPQTPGPGPQRLWLRLMNRYVARLRTVAQYDAEVAGALLKVEHWVAPPASLAAPRTLWRVLHGPRGAAARQARHARQGRQQRQAEGALEASHA